MRKLLSVFFIIYIFIGNFSILEARSGCCSHHGGVCGCGCCDGSSLSNTCAPYYPQCNSDSNTDIPEPNYYNYSTSSYKSDPIQEQKQILNPVPEPVYSNNTSKSEPIPPTKTTIIPESIPVTSPIKPIYSYDKISNPVDTPNKENESNPWIIIIIIIAGGWFYFGKKK